MSDAVSLGVLLFVAGRSLETRVIAAAQEAGYGSVTLAQARIGARIGPGGTRLSDLAEQAQVTKQTATHLVDQLEKAGYVERVPDPTDGRARLVRFTAKGSGIIDIARAVEESVYAEWKAHLGAAKFAQLRAILTELRAVVDPYM